MNNGFNKDCGKNPTSLIEPNLVEPSLALIENEPDLTLVEPELETATWQNYAIGASLGILVCCFASRMLCKKKNEDDYVRV